MNRVMQVSDSVVIDVDAETIWAQVADPAQMPRWSPENTGATTPTTGRPLTVGERFDGTNKRGRARWITECVVTASEPGQRFAFDRTVTGGKLFADFQRRNIRRTLATMKTEFESGDRTV